MGLRNVTRRSTSVVMTASPMLASVTSNHSRCWLNSSVRFSSVSFAATRSFSARWRALRMASMFLSAAVADLLFFLVGDH